MNLADGTITIDVNLDTKTLEESLSNVGKMVEKAIGEANLKLGSITEINSLATVEDRGKNMGIGAITSLEAEEENYNEAYNLFEGYSQKLLEGESELGQNLLAKQNEFYTSKLSAMQKEQDKENNFVNTSQKNIISFLSGFTSSWYGIGEDYMRNLQSGLESRLSAVEELIDDLKRKLAALSDLGGSEDYGSYSSFNVPAYGTGGVVTKAHLAVVGDTPEAIIPLNRLNDIILGVADFAYSGDSNRGNEVVQREVTLNQTNNFYEKTQSPAQSAQAIRRVNKELAQYV